MISVCIRYEKMSKLLTIRAESWHMIAISKSNLTSKSIMFLHMDANFEGEIVGSGERLANVLLGDHNMG